MKWKPNLNLSLPKGATAFLLLVSVVVALALGIALLGGNTLAPSAELPTGPVVSVSEASRWVNPSTPILSPSVTWEGTAVVEPTVIYDQDTWKMWYRGGWSTTAIGYATCPGDSDPTNAANWTKYAGNPVLSGNQQQQPNVIRLGSLLYLYYAVASGDLVVSTSSDGITWSAPTTLITPPSGITQWANSTVWVENGNQWHLLVEGLKTSSSRWEIHLYSSSDGLTWTHENSGNPLTSLQVASGATYSGPQIMTPMPKYKGLYQIWYHAVATVGGALPTNIYRATSPDLINWSIIGPALTFSGSGFEIDQVADAEVVEHNNASVLFFDGDDNGASAGHIGAASFGGPLAALLSKTGLPVYLDASNLLPYSELPLATPSTPGAVQPDNTSITVDGSGILSAAVSAGVDSVIELARWVADGSTTAFTLPDFATYLNFAADNGTLADPVNVGLSSDYGQVVFGSAPDIAGRGIADPRAAILSVGMMLDHLGYHEAANKVRRVTYHTPHAEGARTTDTARLIAEGVGHEMQAQP